MLRFGGVSGRGALGMEPDTELYYRMVASVNRTIVENIERVAGKETNRVTRDTVTGGGLVAQRGSELVVGRATNIWNTNLVSGEGVIGPST